MPARRERMVMCMGGAVRAVQSVRVAPRGPVARGDLRGGSGVRYSQPVLTVISWYAARRSRRQLHEWVARALTDKPTLLAIVSDKYTQEGHLRPFAPVAERLG